MITIMLVRVITTIMITITIKAQPRSRMYQRDLKGPRFPRVLVQGEDRSAILDDLKYVYVEKRIVFVDSQP